MKKTSQLIYVSVAILFASNVSAMQSGPTEDFIGINISKENGHCRMQTADESFAYKGEAKVKYTMNKHFRIATCKADYLQEEPEEAIVVRDEIPCRIAEMNSEFTPGNGHKMIHYDGIGGFTVTPSGQVIGRCTAEKEEELQENRIKTVD